MLPVGNEGKMASSVKRALTSTSRDLPVLMLGLAFLLMGLIMSYQGIKQLLYQHEWSHGLTTTGRVILTEWKQIGKENKLLVSYAYKDDADVIYHNTATLARKLGNVNL